MWLNMFQKRNVGALIALVGGALLLWFALRWDAKSAAPQPAQETETSASEPSAVPDSIAHEEPRATAVPAPVAPTPASTSQAKAQQPTSVAAPGQGIPPPQRTGPVDELAALFAKEPRASDASAIESLVTASFQRPGVPPGLLQSALCRTSVCRVQTQWSPERAQGFLAAVMQLVARPNGDPTDFDPHVAIEPAEASAAAGDRAVTVYLRRLAEPSAEP
jgi:hypothetical protein